MDSPKPIEDYKRIIFNEATHCLNLLPAPKHLMLDDLVSEAAVVYLKVIKRYDSSRKVQFITYFLTALKRRYIDISRAAYYRRFRDVPENYDQASPCNDPFDNVDISKVSKDARRIWNQLMDSKSTYRQTISKRDFKVKELRLLLFKTVGINKYYGRRALSELSIVLTDFNIF